MRKSDLVKAVIVATGLSARQADEAVSATIEKITNALARREALNLVGFGSFTVKVRAARSGRNPQAGVAISIPSRSHVTFKAGKAFKEGLNV
ncbi:MAG: DNA-binding protein HU-beta [Lentisphaeria bacterium]|jgi:DNA-binding protein HU-beta